MSSASEQVISGLEGVLACESSVAFIDGTIPELSYRGYNIHDIAETLTYEQVVYLLWHAELPSADQLGTFHTDLAGRRGLPSVFPTREIQTVITQCVPMSSDSSSFSRSTSIGPYLLRKYTAPTWRSCGWPPGKACACAC